MKERNSPRLIRLELNFFLLLLSLLLPSELQRIGPMGFRGRMGMWSADRWQWSRQRLTAYDWREPAGGTLRSDWSDKHYWANANAAPRRQGVLTGRTGDIAHIKGKNIARLLFEQGTSSKYSASSSLCSPKSWRWRGLWFIGVFIPRSGSILFPDWLAAGR